MTYEEVATRLGVVLCASCGFTIDHDEAQHKRGFTGFITYFDPGVPPIARPMIHWKPRRFTRRGLRNFLLLYAELVIPLGSLKADRFYLRNSLVIYQAHKFHVRFPSRWADADRWRARTLITHGHAASPETRRWIKQLNRKENT